MKKLLLLKALMLCFYGVFASTDDLYFSEYIEGSSNNKAIEIYNGTGASVDLTPYVVKLASNGGDWGSTLDLTGNLADGDVYVIYNAQAAQEIMDEGDVSSNVTYFNGDDALGLFKSDVLIDVIGNQGEDPGSAWDVAGVSGATGEHTLVRKDGITSGTTDWATSAGTDADNSQWKVYDQNEFSYIGSHGAGTLSNKTLITSFTVPNQRNETRIDVEASTIVFDMVEGADVTALIPTIVVSSGAMVSPTTAQNFTNSVTYTVTAEDEITTQDWVASVNFVADTKVLLDEKFDGVTAEEDLAITDWLNIAEVGTRKWIGKEYSGNKYAQFSSYGSSDDANTAWLITPSIDLDNSSNEEFTFDINVGYWNNAGLEILISSDFDGTNVATATWTDISSNFSIPVEPTSGYGSFADAGKMNLNDYTGTVYIGFKYTGSAVTSKTTTYQLDNVKIEEGTTGPSNKAEIVKFELAELIGSAVINSEAATIVGELIETANIASLSPTITVSEGAMVSPTTAQDFSSAVVYKVTAEDGVTTKDWTVNLTVASIPMVSIYDIQYTDDASGDSPLDTNLIKTTGIVTGVSSKGFYIQDKKGAWNGIYVYGTIDVASGDSVVVTGTIKEYYNLTEITTPALNVEVIASGKMLPEYDSIGLADFTEAYEGVLVKVADVECIESANSHGEWKVANTTDTIVVDDEMFDAEPSLGNIYNSIVGIGTYNFGAYKLLPRSADDLDKMANTDNDILRFVIPEQNSSAVIDAENHTVAVEVVAGTDVTALTPGIVVSAGATVNPGSQVTQDFTDPVTYTVTSENGVAQTWVVTVTVYVGVEEGVFSSLTLYPNPFKDKITIANQVEIDEVIISDISGKVIYESHVHSKEVTLSTENLNEGIYLVSVKAISNEIVTIKMMK